MILKGIIEKIIDPYSVRVRIPFLHRTSNSSNILHVDELPEAQISILPNCRPSLQLGDVVIVGFENNDQTKPVIIGVLYSENMSKTSCSCLFDSLTVTADSHLSFNTSIGEVLPLELSYLKGAKDNLQQQINSLETRLSNLQADIAKISTS